MGRTYRNKTKTSSTSKEDISWRKTRKKKNRSERLISDFWMAEYHTAPYLPEEKAEVKE